MRKLRDDQVEAFDREYVDADRFVAICERIDADFPDGKFSFLDVGGGNGRFSDQLLSRYPGARGTVLDNSEVLLERNEPHVRKTVRLGSVEDLDAFEEKFDLLSLHWLLHHLVGDSYAETRSNQRSALHSVGRLLTDRGRVSVFENDYHGWLPDPLPTYIIYTVTASKALAPLARTLGANTAGVGVCFNSFQGWRAMIEHSGLRLLHHAEPDTWLRRLPWYAKAAIGLRQVRVGHYWLCRSS